jgi:hypothetical protein
LEICVTEYSMTESSAFIKFAEQSGLNEISAFLRAVSDGWGWKLLYRGHANASWTALPSAFRPGASGLKSAAQLSRWRSMAQRFASPPPADELAYLVLAQHYGVKTALLDWTSNPLTALFFACEPSEAGRNQPGEVLAIERGHFAFCETTMFVQPFATEREKPLLVDSSAMNPRSTAQDSYMSLHIPKEAPLPTRSIFTIPYDKKHQIRLALELLGLTPERVYVDLAVAASRMMEYINSIDAFDQFIDDLNKKVAEENG